MRVLRAAFATALIGSAGPAAVPPAAAAGDPCGFFARTGTAYYNHCAGDTGTRVEIQIDIPNWPDDYRCVGPGTTKLGSTLSIRNAWYNDRRCPVGGDQATTSQSGSGASVLRAGTEVRALNRRGSDATAGSVGVRDGLRPTLNSRSR